MANSKQMTIETIERQRQYVASQQEKGQGLGVVFADAFLRGMRDIGYKNPAWALAEQIDNAFQAAARNVSISFGFDKKNKSQVKPDLVAISDDGNGMIPEMIGYAVRWGGTDREGNRQGFGRYGYGLPSSAVSLAKRYTVYSKTTETNWHAVTVDVEDLADAAGDIQRTEELLAAAPAELPKWIVKGEKNVDLPNLSSGTVIVLEDLDRLRSLSGWIKTNTLQTKLLQHFGIIYRHWIPECKVFVHGMQVQPVDPLFLMEHARFFDETPVRAVRVEARTFEVETSRGTQGTVSIRASVLPPNFQLEDPDADLDKGKKNRRLEIMKEFNGLLICREKRQIDCVSPRWLTLTNYDRNIKIEINFDAELDEYFGITTSKQQIVVADEMWEKLQHSGRNGGALIDLFDDMRSRREAIRKRLKAKHQGKEHREEPRPSEAAMEESAKFKGVTSTPTPDQEAEAERNLEHEAKALSDVTGNSREEALDALRQATNRRRWGVEFASIPEGPFYRPKRLGEQKRLIFNTDHPFYTKVYDIAPEARAALEVLLFVLAERELESSGDAETFYKAERQRWSERLRYALDVLISDDELMDRSEAVAERIYESVEAKPPAN